MNRKNYITDTPYNSGKYDLDHLLLQKNLFDDLDRSKDCFDKYYNNLFIVTAEENLVNKDPFCDSRLLLSDHFCAVDNFDGFVGTVEVLKLSNILSKNILASDALFKVSYHLSNKNRKLISELNEKLRQFHSKLKYGYSPYLVSEIESLVQDLHICLQLNYKIFKKNLKRLPPVLESLIKRDIRKIIRSITKRSKNLSDISGCEEDAFTIQKIVKPFFHSQFYICLIQKDWLLSWILLSLRQLINFPTKNLAL